MKVKLELAIVYKLYKLYRESKSDAIVNWFTSECKREQSEHMASLADSLSEWWTS